MPKALCFVCFDFNKLTKSSIEINSSDLDVIIDSLDLFLTSNEDKTLLLKLSLLRELLNSCESYVSFDRS